MEKNSKDTLNASEALYGFIAYMTTQPVSMIASSKHNADIWVPEIVNFCKKHNLPDVRKEWTKNLVNNGLSDKKSNEGVQNEFKFTY